MRRIVVLGMRLAAADDAVSHQQQVSLKQIKRSRVREHQLDRAANGFLGDSAEAYHVANRLLIPHFYDGQLAVRAPVDDKVAFTEQHTHVPMSIFVDGHARSLSERFRVTLSPLKKLADVVAKSLIAEVAHDPTTIEQFRVQFS
jgi:phage terminase large subunit-like protein